MRGPGESGIDSGALGAAKSMPVERNIPGASGQRSGASERTAAATSVTGSRAS